MKGAGQGKRRADSIRLGNGVEAIGEVKVDVLAGVEDIKAAYPECDCRRQQQDAHIERAANGNPCGRWRNSQSKAEHQVRPAGKTLGKGIKKDKSQRHG